MFWLVKLIDENVNYLWLSLIIVVENKILFLSIIALQKPDDNTGIYKAVATLRIVREIKKYNVHAITQTSSEWLTVAACDEGGGVSIDEVSRHFLCHSIFFHMLNEERTNRFRSHGDIENCSGSSHDFLNKSWYFFVVFFFQIKFCKFFFLIKPAF